MSETAPGSDTARPGPPPGGRSDPAQGPSDPGLPTPHGPGHDAGGRSDTAGPAGPPGAPTPAGGPADPPTPSDPARRRPETLSAGRPEKPRGLLIRKKVHGAIHYSHFRPASVPDDARELLEHDPEFVKRVGPGTCAVLDGKAVVGHVEITADVWAAARLPEVVRRADRSEREAARLAEQLAALRAVVLSARAMLEIGKAPEALYWVKRADGDPGGEASRIALELEERGVLLDFVAQAIALMEAGGERDGALDGIATALAELPGALPEGGRAIRARVAEIRSELRAAAAKAVPARAAAPAPTDDGAPVDFTDL